MAICGDTCVLSGDFADLEAHQWQLDLSSNEIDVRAFPDDGESATNAYGSWLACAKQGTLSMSSYTRPDFEIGDDLTFSAALGGETYTVPCLVTSLGHSVDAKDVVQFTTGLRVTGDPTIA